MFHICPTKRKVFISQESFSKTGNFLLPLLFMSCSENGRSSFSGSHSQKQCIVEGGSGSTPTSKRDCAPYLFFAQKRGQNMFHICPTKRKVFVSQASYPKEKGRPKEKYLALSHFI